MQKNVIDRLCHAISRMSFADDAVRMLLHAAVSLRRSVHLHPNEFFLLDLYLLHRRDG
jgi:hypothetical protein